MIKLQNFTALYLENKNDEKLLRDFVSQQNHHFGQWVVSSKMHLSDAC